MKYIKQLAIIMGITFFGELIEYLFPFPIPGSVYGLVILFLLLLTEKVKLESVKETGDFLVAIMPVMFIPAAVGLMDSVEQMKSMLVPCLLAIFPVTLIVMLVTGKATEGLLRRKLSEEDKANE